MAYGAIRFSRPSYSNGNLHSDSLMQRTPAPRLWVILARETRMGVIFRRGPSRHVQMIKWGRDNDTFEEGQWFKGRIYERRCDLSPDGTFLIYFAATYKEPLLSWTAISKTPYFTALALWPKGDGWNGGGYFLGPMQIHLDHPISESTAHPDLKAGAQRFRVSSHAKWRGEDAPVWTETRIRDHWRMVEPGSWNDYNKVKGFAWAAKTPETWERSHARQPLRLRMEIHAIHQQDGPWYLCRYFVRAQDDRISNELGFADWAEWDTNGDLLFACGGRLFRQSFTDGSWRQAKVLADFTANKFRNVPPPEWATTF